MKYKDFLIQYINLERNSSRTYREIFSDPYGFTILTSPNIAIEDIEDECVNIYQKHKRQKSIQDDPLKRSVDQVLDTIIDHEGITLDRESFYDTLYLSEENLLQNFKTICKCFNTAGIPREKYKKQMINFKPKINTVKIPHIYQLCNDPKFPVYVSKYDNEFTIKKVQTIDKGEGIFVFNKNQIIDTIKINGLWTIDLPLNVRIKFAHRTKYDVKPYIKVFNFREALSAAKTLGATSKSGILMRSVMDNYIKNYWFRWNENSYYIRRDKKRNVATTLQGYDLPRPVEVPQDYVLPRINMSEKKIYQQILELKN